MLSVAVFDSQVVTPFRSTIKGKEPVQVGRWHAFRRRNESSEELQLPEDSTGIDWESVWARKSVNTLPPELEALKYVHVQYTFRANEMNVNQAKRGGKRDLLLGQTSRRRD